MKVINLYAGPGAGKSTTAAGLFYLMKTKNISCELVTEFAKEWVFDRGIVKPEDQLFILANQIRRLMVIKDKVDYIITDSPLLLNTLYNTLWDLHTYDNLVYETYKMFDNVDFIIKRTKPYHTLGRFQTEDEAKDIDYHIEQFLNKKKIKYIKINGDASAPETILKEILNESQYIRY